MRFSANFCRIILLVAVLFIPVFSYAYDPDEVATRQVATPQTDTVVAPAKKESGFNPSDLIMEHILDGHDWHIYGGIYIPLPVILKTDKGWEFFSSSHFRNPETRELQPYTGKYYTYKIEDNKVVVWSDDLQKKNEQASAHLLDISITKGVVTLFVVVGLLFFIFLGALKAYKKNPGRGPRGIQSIVEPFILFVRDDIAKSSIGPKKYERFVPYLLTVFFFIWISNMIGLIPIFPFGANFTGNITIPMILAVCTFVITTANGNSNYWRHIFAMPGVPVGVLFIITPIEIIGIFLKPFVLMIRLFANISSGHIVALSFYCLIFIFGEQGKAVGAGLGVSVVSIFFTCFMLLLDVLVALLQAYVFTLLSAIYFGAAVEEHHIDEHGVDQPEGSHWAM